MNKVSVIMPVFNGGEFLKESISSILNQTFSNLELVIINDGSTDNSEAVISTFFSDKRIAYHANNSNMGLSFSRGRGIELAKGSLIAFMDADDVSFPDRLAKQVKEFIANPNLAIYGSQAKIILASGYERGTMRKPLDSEELKAQLFFHYPFITPTLCFRANMLKCANASIKGREFEMADDYILLAHMIEAGEWGNLDFPLLSYRVHDEANRVTSDSNNQAIVKGRKMAWRKILQLLALDADDKVLEVHDKLTYYPQKIGIDDLEYLERYLELLTRMKINNQQKKIFGHFFMHHISMRAYKALNLKQLSIARSLFLFSKYQHLLNPVAKLKFPIRKGLSVLNQ